MKKIVYGVTLTVETGLHIGAGNDKMQIGGIDSPVIKDPVTKLPYIPGSSLKGKFRSLLETEGGYDKGEKHKILNTLFGASSEYIDGLSEKEKKELSPTRFIFRDLFLHEDDKKDYVSGKLANEVKAEVKINRKTGTADTNGPRFIERVPAWVEFVGKIVVREFPEDENLKSLEVLLEAANLLKNDYLGGSGSRGYGAVTITIE
ncbi:MAG: type III-A CRISPR-associated RAMP protein Csm3 [Ignavibacteriaceae bacterium]|nr:type III-A CRISPR-associated RAMP protein Csm3 [Ignavibacteriaceae bacterium]